jgi:hypothetical protein
LSAVAHAILICDDEPGAPWDDEPRDALALRPRPVHGA